MKNNRNCHLTCHWYQDEEIQSHAETVDETSQVHEADQSDSLSAVLQYRTFEPTLLDTPQQAHSWTIYHRKHPQNITNIDTHVYQCHRVHVQSNISVQHYRCVALCFTKIHQKSHQFWAASLASGRSMSNEDRSLQTCRMQVEHSLPGVFSSHLAVVQT